MLTCLGPSGSRLSNYLAYQIVLVSFGDSHIVDLTQSGFKIFGHVVDQDVAVDILRLALKAALKEQIRFLRDALEHYLVGIADLGLIKLFADLGLFLHQLIST